ncbi:MAG: DNA-binding response regulator [Chloroflexi bacterium HGW-Chloroflexi-10]|nr:MAG: DNA-binding response regulator [Chloroflexi bacterium HGW-Chloroflexi-10]
MNSVRTLIADDHALVRAGLRDALTKLPQIEIVGEVANGRELVEAINMHSTNLDLLVVDVNMPEFEPIAVIQNIRDQYPDLKILVVSAYDDQAYVVGLLSAGVNGYHIKDQPLADLHLAVLRILEGSRWISAPLVDRLVHHQTTLPEKNRILSPRQRELLYLLTQGFTNQKIAQVMDLSVKTVENHLTALYRAIGVESRLEAGNYAAQHPEQLSSPTPKKIPNRYDTPSNALSVLLVDDNPRYRAQLAKLLGKTCPAAYCLFEAEDCDEALRIAISEKPQLAFVDVILQEEDGIECIRRIKIACPNTRMILMSAYPDREFRRLGMNAGAIAFLDKKDIDAATVRQVVEDALAL